jgi:hypothetical protein
MAGLANPFSRLTDPPVFREPFCFDVFPPTWLAKQTSGYRGGYSANCFSIFVWFPPTPFSQKVIKHCLYTHVVALLESRDSADSAKCKSRWRLNHPGIRQQQNYIGKKVHMANSCWHFSFQHSLLATAFLAKRRGHVNVWVVHGHKLGNAVQCRDVGFFQFDFPFFIFQPLLYSFWLFHVSFYTARLSESYSARRQLFGIRVWRCREYLTAQLLIGRRKLGSN